MVKFSMLMSNTNFHFVNIQSWRFISPLETFLGLQKFERKRLAKVKNDGYENHL